MVKAAFSLRPSSLSFNMVTIFKWRLYRIRSDKFFVDKGDEND